MLHAKELLPYMCLVIVATCLVAVEILEADVTVDILEASVIVATCLVTADILEASVIIATCLVTVDILEGSVIAVAILDVFVTVWFLITV